MSGSKKVREKEPKEKEKKKDIVGTRQGIFNIIYKCPNRASDGHILYHVKCRKCGWETDIKSVDIGRMSKACHHKNRAGQYVNDLKKVKWENERLHRIYKCMITRCYTPTNKDFRWYGAKGVKIYQEWLDSPKSFENWALENGYEDNLTIDRYDESKDYCPENCHWITASDNSKYKTTTHIITVDDVSHTGREWSRLLNLGGNTINSMIQKYGIRKVKKFIRARLADPDKTRDYHESWFNVYGIE